MHRKPDHAVENCRSDRQSLVIREPVDQKPGGIINKTFIQMMEALGYDVELRYIKREEKTK